MNIPVRQLVSYIAPAAPATRRPANGNPQPVRLEIGFTPRWYRQHLDIEFGRRWHTDPAYRRETLLAMRSLLRQTFPGSNIARIDQPERPLDLLTGTYGATIVAAIYGVPPVYAADNWPNCQHQYLTDQQVEKIEPPDLDTNAPWQQLMDQVDWIARSEGRVEGFINWQGILNNAFRLRGQQILLDIIDAPDRARHVFQCVFQTVRQAAGRLYARQRKSGVDVRFFTVSNCLVNMVSPQQYRDLLLPFDQRMAQEFECLGIHNCAWNADGYLASYATIPNVGYVDMGIQTDLPRARQLFPHARRAVMYTPMDVASKSIAAMTQDFTRIARDLAPCDIVLADIDAGVPDEKIRALLQW